MSFFNSVVSAVVGAVAAVANAVVSAAKSIVSAVSGKGSQDAGGMTALGAIATIADVFEDGEIDEDEEELLVEAFKLLVGAFIFPFGSGSSSAEIDSNENTCKNEPTLWSKTCNLGAGVLDGAKGTLDGLANRVKHPIDTINSARSFAENPEYAARVGKAIWKEIKDEYKRDVIEGDANSESYFTGKALFEAALLFGPTVTKLNKSEKIGKASEVISEAEKITEELSNASKSLPTKIPYEFMDDTVEHIFKGSVKNSGTADEYASGCHYIGNDMYNGNEIIKVTRNADEFGTIEAKVEIAGVTKDGISTLFSNKYTPDEVVDMIMQAHMNKTLVQGSRGLYRGVADNGMTIEMYLYRNPEGCNISDVITAYPVHSGTLN